MERNLVSLGPQLSLRSTYYDSYEGFISGTKGCLIQHDKENEERSMISDTVQCFEAFYGTGSSSVNAYYSCIAKEISNIKPNLSHLHEALAIFEELFTLSCQTLELSIDEPVSLYEPIHDTDIATTTPDMDCGDNDDTSWFFDDEPSLAPAPAVALAPFAQYTDAATPDTTDSGLQSVGELADFSDAWLAVGLQHCLLHDWHDDGNSNHTCDNLEGTALPMKLAIAAAVHLWSSRSCNGAQSPPGDSSLLATARSIALSRQRGIDPAGGVGGRLRRSLQAVHLHTVHGVQAGRSCVQHNAVVFNITMARLSLAMSFGRMDCADGDGGDGGGGGNRFCGVDSASFRGVAFLKPDAADFGEEADTTAPGGLGTSQQARAVSVATVLTVDQAVRSYQQESRGDSHLQRVVAHLSRLGVSLVLCSRDAHSDRLADACASRRIALLPLNNRQLESLSCAAGVGCAESLLGLRPEDVGFRASGLGLRVLLEAPPQDSASTRGVDLRGDNQVLAADDWGHDHNSTLVCLTIIHSDGPVHGFLSADAQADGLVDGTLEVLPVSVVICAPTAIMAACIADRFHRCLHRVRVFLESGGGVLPGAGLPEMLCSVYLQDLVRQRLVCVNGDDSEGGDDSGRVVTSLLSSFRRALDAYSLTVLLNNGATYPEALAAIDAAESSLHQSHQRHMLDGGCGDEPPSVLGFVSGLTARDKLRLQGPIDIGGIPGMGGSTAVAASHVLDVAEVKVEAMRAALDAVR